MERFEIDLTFERINLILLGLEAQLRFDNDCTETSQELRILQQQFRFIQKSFGDKDLQTRITELSTPQ